MGTSSTAFGALLLSVLAGALLPLQAGANGVLARALGHPLHAALGSLAGSALIVIVLALLMRAPVPDFAAAARMPAWTWGGGAIGALFVTVALLLAPRLGATGFVLAVVAGQLCASLLLDALGGFGYAARGVAPARIAGVGLVLAGLLVFAVGERCAASAATPTVQPMR